MKRDEIIAKWNGMTPRERDAWVAEVVFGWKPLGDGRMRSSDGFMIRAIPEYTTDISAAWAVVDRYYSYRITRLNGVDHYRVVLHDEDGDLRAYAHSSSAPEAIGLAAILAKSLTEEGAT